MKAFFIILLLAVSGIIALNHKGHTHSEESTIESWQSSFKQGISIVYFQDISGSITTHGVEIDSTSIFNRYYECVDRDVNLYYGTISSNSAHKLIHLELPPFAIPKPIEPNLQTAVNVRELKDRYDTALKQFLSDSITYYADRKRRIQQFNGEVAYLLVLNKDSLASKSDVVTAISLAEKVFNGYADKAVRTFLILNSDGMDSYNRVAPVLKHAATVILVNASGSLRTCLANVPHTEMASTEDAITFTLNHNN